jgi:hypothetical protein
MLGLTVGHGSRQLVAERQVAAAVTPPASADELAAVDLADLTPRQAADHLFDRVMRALIAHNVTEARNFLPMAIAAYVDVDSLGPDGAFHLATLQRVGADNTAALETTRAALAQYPDHLLVLGEAAAASLGLGDTVFAQQYAGRFLEVYETEVQRDLEDYAHHLNILDDLRQRALVIVR